MSESFFEARKKKFAVLAVASAKALTPPPSSELLEDARFCLHVWIYMFLKWMILKKQKKTLVLKENFNILRIYFEI